MKIFLFAWTVAGLPLAAQQKASEKIDSRLAQLLESPAKVRVLILLREQPHKEIYERMMGASRLWLELAEGDWRRAMSRIVLSELELRIARERYDSVVVETRQAVLRETASRIRSAQASVEGRLAVLGASNVQAYTTMNLIAAEVPASGLRALAEHPEVALIQPDELHLALLDVSAAAIGAPAFWNRGLTGIGETVAVIDSGIRMGHPAFDGRDLPAKVASGVVKQWECFQDEPDSAVDKHGHGTHVAGIIASVGPPGFANLAGVARGLGRLLTLKALFQTK